MQVLPIRSSFAALVLILAATGCAIDHGIRPATDLRESDFRRLTAGMTAAEVEGIVGKPMLRTPLPRMQEEAWDYRYFDALTPIKVLVYFDLKGILKRTTQGYDHEYYHGGAER